MEARSLAYAGYWRNALADTELGSGALSRSDVRGFVQLPATVAATGVVPQSVVDEYFIDESSRVATVEVVYRPHVRVARTEHGKRPAGIPEFLTPLVTHARLARDGRLYPIAGTVVPRDLLEPLERGSYVLGTVSDLDTFLTSDAVPGIEFDSEARAQDYESSWRNYSNGCARLLQAVCPRLSEDDSFEVARYGYLVKKASVTGAAKHILALYDHISRHSPPAPLFERFASDTIEPVEACLPAHSMFPQRLAHASDTFALAPAQRDALTHLLAARPGEILAINGPPGTGKTTLLLSIVASLWAKSALEETEPPVIIAASTNNQAVTNIIDAFGRDFAPGEGALAGRWLPEIKCFGAFFPAAAKEADASMRYQTHSFFDHVESATYVAAAEAHYLKCAAAAFPDLDKPTVSSVVARLRERLRIEADKLAAIDTAWERRAESQRAVRLELGDDPIATIARYRRESERLQKVAGVAKSVASHWDDYQVKESLFYSLFAWLPPVARKRLLRARHAVKHIWPNETLDRDWSTIDQIQTAVNELVRESLTAAREHALLLQRSEALFEAQQRSLRDWTAALDALTPVASDASLAQIDALADCRLRFPIFLLTTHYWEGRWLLDMQPLLPELEKEKRKNGRVAMEKCWRRRMKLTPCVVSTLHMLPQEMKVRRPEANKFVDDYLYGFADLLIVDEAGQVLPEVAAASFSLAKRALVIGDTLQIEPMWGVTRQVDIGNLIQAGLIPADDHDAAYQKLSEFGKSVSSGCVMRIAQVATRYHYDRDLARGLQLYEHRRCFDEIIGYCNDLCYQGKLIPRQGKKAAAIAAGTSVDDGLPAMGYLHVDGICETPGSGSRHNQLEAETIASWLVAHRESLEAAYAPKKLHEIVGVITPFNAQVRSIMQACQKVGIAVGVKESEMTVGTVNALQGAERPVVIFSPVYSKHASGGFIDKRRLNVAVSRAKNSFLVFGDMDEFQVAARDSPRGRLAAVLFADDANELHFEYRRRRDLGARATISQLIDPSEHDAFLLSTIANSSDLIIVTPWIRLQCLQDTGAMAAMTAAAGGGARIRIYTDLSFNTDDRHAPTVIDKRRELQRVIDLLAAQKIQTLVVWRVHSKVVIGDENVYCVGSFNWFSAPRNGDYARHDTSLVYRGPALAKEIEVMKASLSARVTRYQR